MVRYNQQFVTKEVIVGFKIMKLTFIFLDVEILLFFPYYTCYMFAANKASVETKVSSCKIIHFKFYCSYRELSDRYVIFVSRIKMDVLFLSLILFISVVYLNVQHD